MQHALLPAVGCQKDRQMLAGREALLPTVGAGEGVPAEAGDKGQVQAEAIGEPIHSCNIRLWHS